MNNSINFIPRTPGWLSPQTTIGGQAGGERALCARPRNEACREHLRIPGLPITDISRSPGGQIPEPISLKLSMLLGLVLESLHVKFQKDICNAHRFIAR